MPRPRNYFQPSEFGRDKNPDWYGSARLGPVKEKPGCNVGRSPTRQNEKRTRVGGRIMLYIQAAPAGSHREDGATCDALNHQWAPKFAHNSVFALPWEECRVSFSGPILAHISCKPLSWEKAPGIVLWLELAFVDVYWCCWQDPVSSTAEARRSRSAHQKTFTYTMIQHIKECISVTIWSIKGWKISRNKCWSLVSSIGLLLCPLRLCTNQACAILCTHSSHSRTSASDSLNIEKDLSNVAYSKLKCHSYPNTQNESYVNSHVIFHLSLRLFPQKQPSGYGWSRKMYVEHYIAPQSPTYINFWYEEFSQGRIYTFGRCSFAIRKLPIGYINRDLRLFFSLHQLFLVSEWWVTLLEDMFKGVNSIS